MTLSDCYYKLDVLEYYMKYYIDTRVLNGMIDSTKCSLHPIIDIDTFENEDIQIKYPNCPYKTKLEKYKSLYETKN